MGPLGWSDVSKTEFNIILLPLCARMAGFIKRDMLVFFLLKAFLFDTLKTTLDSKLNYGAICLKPTKPISFLVSMTTFANFPRSPTRTTSMSPPSPPQSRVSSPRKLDHHDHFAQNPPKAPTVGLLCIQTWGKSRGLPAVHRSTFLTRSSPANSRRLLSFLLGLFIHQTIPCSEARSRTAAPTPGAAREFAPAHHPASAQRRGNPHRRRGGRCPE